MMDAKTTLHLQQIKAVEANKVGKLQGYLSSLEKNRDSALKKLKISEGNINAIIRVLNISKVS